MIFQHSFSTSTHLNLMSQLARTVFSYREEILSFRGLQRENPDTAYFTKVKRNYFENYLSYMKNLSKSRADLLAQKYVPTPKPPPYSYTEEDMDLDEDDGEYYEDEDEDYDEDEDEDGWGAC